ncbi:MAG TPA: hypothetical protein PK843_16480 [bacterium]|nr:hypothetical protein [bacterium]
MNRCRHLLPLIPLLFAVSLHAAEIRSLKIVWHQAPRSGSILVSNGLLRSSRVALGKGKTNGNRFSAAARAPFALEVNIEADEYPAALVSLQTDQDSCSFFLRDVHRDHPIFLPFFGLAVTEAQDPRDYSAIASQILRSGRRTKLEQINQAPEESFAHAAAQTQEMSCQTWLGLSRDMRTFAVSERLDWVQPRMAGTEIRLAETNDRAARYRFIMGRGWGVQTCITRRLDEGCLPILHGTLIDESIRYELTAFAGMEKQRLQPQTLRGTHFLVADGYSAGHTFTAEQEAAFKRLELVEMNQPEETVLFLRVTAENTAQTPRYAFLKTATPLSIKSDQWALNPTTGLSSYKTGRVFAASRLNDRPLPIEEVSVLLQPGGRIQLTMAIPNRPIPEERARALQGIDFDQALTDCRGFWQAKLAAAAQIELPEQRIEEMIRAGLLHLDLITYGLEPDGTLAPAIGVYCPIGSESAPIIQTFDSMGRHDIARRALTYFLDKQHDDGMMQNFGGYMLETGAVLWSLGEHYRYTRDDTWLVQIAPHVIKACNYLIAWRRRNLREELRGRGYGMLEGKTADPEDPFHSFMLSGYAYLGLSRAAEMYQSIDPVQAERWRQEAADLRRDIRTAVFEGLAKSPVIPLADGTWRPTLAPWAEYRGPLALHADGGAWFTHGAMITRDSLLGPLYLVLQEVIDAREPAAEYMLQFHNDLMTLHNAAFSQPYYSRHPLAHLQRGEPAAFLKAYYNTVAALADRQTYTFWEHLYEVSPHKTHEEGWFLMQTRWMLYIEAGAALNLLPGIPRSYLEPGKKIRLKNVASYFGPLSLEASSHLGENKIVADIECTSERKPACVVIRLPHPNRQTAESVQGGVYDPTTESVRIEPFTGRAHVELLFAKQ